MFSPTGIEPWSPGTKSQSATNEQRRKYYTKFMFSSIGFKDIVNIKHIFYFLAAVGVSHNVYIGLELKHIQVINIKSTAGI